MQITQLIDRALSHFRQHCLTNTERFLDTVKDWYRYDIISTPVSLIIFIIVVVVIVIIISYKYFTGQTTV